LLGLGSPVILGVRLSLSWTADPKKVHSDEEELIHGE
jgi:hypothetical protein